MKYENIWQKTLGKDEKVEYGLTPIFKTLSLNVFERFGIV